MVDEIKVGSIVMFPELWGGCAVNLKGQVQEVTRHRMTILSLSGSSAGMKFDYVDPRLVRLFVR